MKPKTTLKKRPKHAKPSRTDGLINEEPLTFSPAFLHLKIRKGKYFPIGKRPRKPFNFKNIINLPSPFQSIQYKTFYSLESPCSTPSPFSSPLLGLSTPFLRKKVHPFVKRVVRQLYQRRSFLDPNRNKPFWCPFVANQITETLPLMTWAIRHRDFEAVRVMLAFGANPNLCGFNNPNSTPIHTAVHRHDFSDLPQDIMELLIQHGAYPVWRDNDEDSFKKEDWERIFLMIEQEKLLSRLSPAKAPISLKRL